MHAISDFNLAFAMVFSEKDFKVTSKLFNFYKKAYISVGIVI